MTTATKTTTTTTIITTTTTTTQILPSSPPPLRGALIVLEGCDKTGKTTQAQRLVQSLNNAGKPAMFMRFPDRTTEIGKIIDSYLKCNIELEDHSVHLLFSANRWEALPKIMSTLLGGTSLIIDRYAFSGVVFSAAKENMNLEWCKQSDAGLPKPDGVFFLDFGTKTTIESSSCDNKERYEEVEFQKKVYENYHHLLLKEDDDDESWKIIDVKNKTIEDLQKELIVEAVKIIDKVDGIKIDELWS